MLRSLAEAYTLKGDYATGWSHVERALAVAQEFKQLHHWPTKTGEVNRIGGPLFFVGMIL